MSAAATLEGRAVSGHAQSAAPGPVKAPRLTATTWAPQHDLAHQQWLAEGRRVGAMARGSAWWVGDWLLYGVARWGDRYAEASRVTGYDPKTLRNMRYVASRFHLSLRRDNLTFSHHALLASFEVDAQRHWLDRATRDRMSVDDLRIELRAARREAHAEPSSENREHPTQSPRAPASTAQESALSPAPNDGSHVIRCPHCGEGIAVT
jgi:hypothetical protein